MRFDFKISLSLLEIRENCRFLDFFVQKFSFSSRTRKQISTFLFSLLEIRDMDSSSQFHFLASRQCLVFGPEGGRAPFLNCVQLKILDSILICVSNICRSYQVWLLSLGPVGPWGGEGTLSKMCVQLYNSTFLILSWLLSSLIVVSGPCSFFVLSLSTWELEAILEIMPLEMAKIAHFSTATKLKLLQIYQSYFNWAQNHGKFINSCSRMSWVI